MIDIHLSDRATLILRYLIDRYIQEGQPVGSKLLAELPGLEVSSATVRHGLAELEDLGLVMAPHRSAGRVPTALGLRYFVDYLLEPLAPEDSLRLSAEQSLMPMQTTNELINTASRVLSQLTHWVGVVTVPKIEQMILRHIEFLPLSANRLLAVLVVNNRDIQNRMITMPYAISALELQQAAQFLNQHFCGRDLEGARQELIGSLKAHQLDVDRVMQAAIDMATQAFDTSVGADDSLRLAGEHQALSRVQANSVDELQRFAAAFAEKQQMAHLLNECLLSEGVNIFIGEESGYDRLTECSLVTTRYHVHGKPVGVLGVIGPTRMQYSQVVSVVDMTAKLLSSALKSEQESP